MIITSIDFETANHSDASICSDGTLFGNIQFLCTTGKIGA
jgi:hypothetical protein